MFLKNQFVVIVVKYQFWGDGIVMMVKCGDVNFVCGDYMLKFLLIGWVFKCCGVIVVNNQGGVVVVESLKNGIECFEGEGVFCLVLIYLEGYLIEVGMGMCYCLGVWCLFNQFDCLVVLVVINLGQCWLQ